MARDGGEGGASPKGEQLRATDGRVHEGRLRPIPQAAHLAVVDVAPRPEAVQHAVGGAGSPERGSPDRVQRNSDLMGGVYARYRKSKDNAEVVTQAKHEKLARDHRRREIAAVQHVETLEKRARSRARHGAEGAPRAGR